MFLRASSGTRKVKTGEEYMSDYDWAKKPTIIIAPELRARDLEPISVGELMADLTLQSLKQFPLRNGSLERLDWSASSATAQSARRCSSGEEDEA